MSDRPDTLEVKQRLALCLQPDFSLCAPAGLTLQDKQKGGR